MKIFAISTESHRILKDEWFLPSLCDRLPVEIEEAAQLGDGSIGNENFNGIMLQKVRLILRAIEEMWGSWFIYSDVDVQFLRPFRSLAESCLAHRDICFQQDSPTGELCAGFFAARGNAAVRRLWKDVEELLKTDLSQHDQTWLNHLLDPAKFLLHPDSTMLQRSSFAMVRKLRLLTGRYTLTAVERRLRLSLQRLSGVNVDMFPGQVFGAGTLTGRGWNPDRPFKIPRDAAVHHANYASGIDAKIAQLRYVQDGISRLKNR